MPSLEGVERPAPVTPDAGAHWYQVPAGTHAVTCAGPRCHARMFWIAVGPRRIPVDCDVVGGELPSAVAMTSQPDLFTPDVHDGRGVSHFTTCLDAALFGRSSR